MHLNQAEVETLSLLYFRLGYCGSDEEVKALTSVAIGAAPARMNIRSDGESFWEFFSENCEALLNSIKNQINTYEKKCLVLAAQEAGKL